MNFGGRGGYFRGRGRYSGGSFNRPYFFFRRNGRVIPAHGTGSDNPTRFPAAGWSRGRGRPSGQEIDLNSSFLRPENYVVPSDGVQVMSYAIDWPVQCPGWHLYFTNEPYVPESECALHIKAMEDHYTKYLVVYDVMNIQEIGWFVLNATVVHGDATLKEAWPTLDQDLVRRPLKTLAIFGVAMHSLASVTAFEANLSSNISTKSWYVPPQSHPGKIYVRPIGFQEVDLMATINTAKLDHMITVRGRVIAMGDVEMSASWVTYRCPRCSQEQAFRQKGTYPSRPYSCKRDGCLAKQGFIEVRSSPHTRITPIQIVRLAETNIQAIMEEIYDEPQYIDVEVRDDLVDKLPPGQEMIVTGVLRMRPLVDEGNIYQQGPSTSAARPIKSSTLNIFLKVVHVTIADEIPHSFTEKDQKEIAGIKNELDSFKLLVHSLAPELHGQAMAKAGLLLSLLGGAETQLENERDISVLLVGDPGIGKSHVLQMCAAVAQPSSLMGGKRGAGGPNSTLLPDIKNRGDFTLNSGALLNGSSGHCCLDDVDRLASQQENLAHIMQTSLMTLSYPSLFATLSSPISVIASINSSRGHYDQSRSLVDNIKIHPTLLQQFDLIFLLQDKPNKEADVLLTEHVHALHSGAKKSDHIAAQYDTKPKIEFWMHFVDDAADEDSTSCDLEQRLRLKLINGFQEEELDLLPPNLIKKYLAYTRQTVKPLLDSSAADELKEYYLKCREQMDGDMAPSVGIRQLESLIRLTQARARLDFAQVATQQHVRDVISIITYSQADISRGDYVDLDPAGGALATTSAAGKSGSAKKFVQMLQARSRAIGRRMFDFDDLKEVARRVGITSGVTALVESINYQGFLIKRGPDMYEVMPD